MLVVVVPPAVPVNSHLHIRGIHALGAVRGGHGPLLVDERGAARIAAPSPLEDPVVLERRDRGAPHNASRLDAVRLGPFRRGICPIAPGPVAVVEPWLSGGRA
eukprot:scaffold78682_cov50-Phaeocystis_antarctica.AAC.4